MDAVFTPVELAAKTPRQHFMELWQSLEQKLNVQLTIHDHTGSLFLSDGGMLHPQGNLHRSAYCVFNRKRNIQSCIDHCHWAVMREAARLGKPFISRCHAGAVELILPLMRRNEHVATIFAGTFRERNQVLPKSWTKQQKNLYLSMNVWQQSSIPLLLNTLEQFGAAALAFAGNERFSAQQQTNRSSEIRDFFQRSAVSPEITLNDLADFLGLSHSRTSHVLKEEFGKTFNELLNASRIKRACDLLLTTQLSLKRIAHLSGFSNEYYFGRVFKKQTNLPPGAYRKKFSPEMIAAVNTNTTAEISGSSGT